jgi:glutathione reductase (NADPH)
MESFDVLVLGSGPAGGKIAAGLARAGLQVGIADDPVGGTCALRGCNPKKVLVSQADLLDRVQRLHGHGLRADTASLDWGALIRFAREFTDPVPEKTTRGLEAAGARVIRGHGRFTGPRTLQVGEAEVTAGTVVVATGAAPVPLPFPGADLLLDSAGLFQREDLPRRVVFVGAGYVATELASVARMAGAEVTLLEMAPRLLPLFDPDLAHRLADLLRASGLELRLGHTVTGVERTGEGLAVHAEHDGGEVTLAADLVVHGAGRRPQLAGLNLEAAGVTYGPAGVAVDDDLRSVSNPQVLAAGDCADTPLWPLTPAAELEARIVRESILAGKRQHAREPVVPSVAFTLPPLARVGLLESEAREQGLPVTVRSGETDRWGSVRKAGGRGGAYKLVIDQERDLLVGAHLLGPGAEETINLLALAMTARWPASDLRALPFAFPTHASDLAQML